MSIDTMIAQAVAEEVARLLQGKLAEGHLDDLVRLPGPLERRTAEQLVKAGRLPATRLGRHLYTRRRYLAALVADPTTFDAERKITDHIHRKKR